MSIRGLISNKGLLTAISLKAGSGDYINLTLLPLDEEIRASKDIVILSIKFPRKDFVPLEGDSSIKIFKDWYRKFGTKISLLGYDLNPKIEIIKGWLKDDYDTYFSKSYRDIKQIEFFLQDTKAFNGESRYEEPSLIRLGSDLGFSDDYFKLPQRECLFLAEVYRRLLHKMG